MNKAIKILFTIALFVLIGVNVLNKPSTEIDSVIGDFVSWAETVNSFKAKAMYYDNQNNLVGSTLINFSGDSSWEMIIEDKGIVQVHWVKVGDDVFVEDFSDNKWWHGKSNEPVLTSMVDFRRMIDINQDKWSTVQFELHREQWCGVQECMMYLVFDPAYESVRENISHKLWLTKENSQLVAQEYVGDTGKAEIVYSGFNQTEIPKPNDYLIKEIEDEANLFVLPNSIQATYSAKMGAQLPLIFPYSPL